MSGTSGTVKHAVQAGALVALLGGAGVLHLIKPAPFDSIVPPRLPGTRRFYTLASGVAELATAALVAVPSTRRLGGRAAAALFVGVFPANVQMAWDWRHDDAVRKSIAFGRLPIQPLLVAWALRVASSARG